MAGKYHRDFNSYARTGGGHQLAPGSKIIPAYAEGYNAYRSGRTRDDNPHLPSVNDDSEYQSWLYGFQDGERGEPATHVGGPDAVAPPEPDPGELELLEEADRATTHAAIDAVAAELGVARPDDWSGLTIAEKRGVIHAALAS